MNWWRLDRRTSSATGAAGAGFSQSVEIEGAAELEAKLQELPRKVENKVRRSALRAGAKIVLAKAKQLAPRKTGTLRRSLKVKVGRRKKNTLRFFVQTKDGDYRGETFYGAFVEFGHRVGSRKLRTRKKIGLEKRKPGQRGRTRGIYSVDDSRPVVAPKPYLEPAFEQSKEQSLQTIISTTTSGILEAAKAKAAA